MTTNSSATPDGDGVERIADALDDPTPDVPPEPSRDTGATASERASAQVAAELSGRRGPDGMTEGDASAISGP
jgi:hypothetical protein